MNPRELLRSLMEKEGLNPNRLSSMTKGATKQPQIHRFVTGESKEPKRSTLEPVAKVFGISVEAFFDSKAADLAWEQYLKRKQDGAFGPIEPPLPPKDFADPELNLPPEDALLLEAVKIAMTEEEQRDLLQRAAILKRHAEAVLSRKRGKL